MTANPSIDPARFLHEELAQASPDLMRELLGTFINTLLSAQADTVCGAEYGTRSPERVNRRNGYRHRDLDTRAGTIDVAIPKLREGTYFPDWLLTRHRRAEAALTTVVATCYLLGVSHPADGQAGADAGDHRAVQVAGVGDGQGPRRAGRGVPHPPVGRGAVHVRGRGRADDEGPRGRPGGQGRGHGRHRRQRRRATARSSGSALRQPSPAPAGWGSSATWSPAACPGSPWSPPTRTPGWSTRSGRPCRAPPGSGAAPTTPRT